MTTWLKSLFGRGAMRVEPAPAQAQAVPGSPPPELALQVPPAPVQAQAVPEGSHPELALQILIEELLPYLLEKTEEVERTAASLRKAQEQMARNLKFVGCDISVVESTVRSLVMASSDDPHASVSDAPAR